MPLNILVSLKQVNLSVRSTEKDVTRELVRWNRSYLEYLKGYKPSTSIPTPSSRRVFCKHMMKARQHLPLHLIQGQPADKSVSDTASAARWSAVNPVPTGVFTLRAHSEGFMGCAGCGLLVSATWYEIVPVYVWESVHSLCALFNANCLWSRSYALRVLKYRNNIIYHVINGTLI